MCIGTLDKPWTFSGSTAMLSRTVVTSCVTEFSNGCNGGWMGSVWTYTAEHGLPTGSDTGCNPYFATGAGIDHFNENQAQPACMSHCFNSGYERTMGADLFKSAGIGRATFWSSGLYGTTHMHPVARNVIFDYGPASLGMAAADDRFYGYSGGIYDVCGGDENHALTAIGYGPGYFTIMNSWGAWGACNEGLCGGGRIADCAIGTWAIPGYVDPAEDFPLPLPGQGPPTPPPPPTQGPPPTPAPEWAVDGPCDRECTTSPTGHRSCCVTSPRYPSNYNSHSECSISVGFGKIEVEEFSTESGYDKLKVNGQEYHGSNGPNGVEATTAIEWKADC
jgi:hypothetical protein